MKKYSYPKLCKNCDNLFQPHSPRQFYCKSCGSPYFKKWYKKQVKLGKRHKQCSCGNKIRIGSKMCKSCASVIVNKRRANSGKPYVNKKGENHGNWKGTSIKTQTGRKRAQKMYGKQPCCRCENTIGHIHHIDLNPLNNSSDNIIRLCNSCHQKEHRNLIDSGIQPDPILNRRR